MSRSSSSGEYFKRPMSLRIFYAIVRAKALAVLLEDKETYTRAEVAEVLRALAKVANDE